MLRMERARTIGTNRVVLAIGIAMGLDQRLADRYKFLA